MKISEILTSATPALTEENLVKVFTKGNVYTLPELTKMLKVNQGTLKSHLYSLLYQSKLGRVLVVINKKRVCLWGLPSDIEIIKQHLEKGGVYNESKKNTK